MERTSPEGLLELVPRRLLVWASVRTLLVVGMAIVMIVAGHTVFGVVWITVAITSAIAQVLVYARAVRRAVVSAHGAIEHSGEPAQ